jgi:hypothetical protein
MDYEASDGALHKAEGYSNIGKNNCCILVLPSFDLVRFLVLLWRLNGRQDYCKYVRVLNVFEWPNGNLIREKKIKKYYFTTSC